MPLQKPMPSSTRGFVRAISATSWHPRHYGRFMGRPRIYDEPRIATAIRLPASLRDQLRAAATEREVSVNFLVTRAVLHCLQRLPAIDAAEPPRARAGHRRATARATS